MSVWELLKAPGVAKVVYIYSHVMTLAFGYTASTYIHTIIPAGRTNKRCSHASLLVYRNRARRVRVFTIRNVSPHVCNRHITGPVDAHHVPASPKALGNRWRATRMHLILADILSLSTIQQFHA